MKRLVPKIEELEKEYERFVWGGRFSISTSYYNPKYMWGKVHWSSSWENSLKEAIERAIHNEYWITLIYRSKDNVKRGYRGKQIRFLGYVDIEGKFHLFKYFHTIEKAIEIAFTESKLKKDG